MCLLFLSVRAQMLQFVDLGLPSGTLWKSTNEPGFYTYDEALKNGLELLTTIKKGKQFKMCFYVIMYDREIV